MSQRETILDALRATLSGLCSGRVYRTRKEQLPSVPAIVIRPESEDDPGEMLGCTDATLTVAIAIYAKGDTPDQAADSTLAAVLDALKPDSTLGLGSDIQVKPTRRIDWNFENYDDAEVILRLEITYRTF